MSHSLTLSDIERGAQMAVRSARFEIAYFERRLHMAHRWQSPDARKRLEMHIRRERETLWEALGTLASIRTYREGR